MQRKEIEKLYIKKINELENYDRAYFEHDSSLISDENYDSIKHEILELEKEYKYLKHKNSPSQKVGYKPKKVKEKKEMGLIRRKIKSLFE